MRLQGPPGWHLSPVSVAWSDYYPLDGMLVHRRVTPSIFAGTDLYTWVERGTVRVKCLGQEHNTMSPARTRTRTTRSGVKHTDHEATAPCVVLYNCVKQALFSIFFPISDIYTQLQNTGPLHAEAVLLKWLWGSTVIICVRVVPRLHSNNGTTLGRIECCLCIDISKWLDPLVFSDIDFKSSAPSHNTFIFIILCEVKEPTQYSQIVGHAHGVTFPGVVVCSLWYSWGP